MPTKQKKLKLKKVEIKKTVMEQIVQLGQGSPQLYDLTALSDKELCRWWAITMWSLQMSDMELPIKTKILDFMAETILYYTQGREEGETYGK